MVSVMVPVMGLVSILIKHVGEDRNEGVGEGSGRRDSGRAADVLRQSSEVGRRW